MDAWFMICLLRFILYTKSWIHHVYNKAIKDLLNPLYNFFFQASQIDFDFVELLRCASSVRAMGTNIHCLPRHCIKSYYN
jgi:hypothetical protein